ncbi:hypothetical protein ACHAWF_006444 [Thalassiosira exigua]
MAAAAPPSPFDLQAYISRYDPHSETHLQRLLFLAHRFHELHRDDGDSSSAGEDASGLAVQRMKRAGNSRRYLEEYGGVEALPSSACGAASPAQAGGEIAGLAGTPVGARGPSRHAHHSPHPPQKHAIQQYLDYDPAFPHHAKLSGQAQLEALEGRLSTAQSLLQKESIRSALLALAEFHREKGELREAWRRVARSSLSFLVQSEGYHVSIHVHGREYCANGQQHTQACLLLLELSVDLREWSSVRDTISRAEHTVMGNLNHDPLFHQKLRTGSALAHLAEGRYSDAAQAFASVSLELTNQFHSVLSAEDLALYGALLGLATLDRDNLHAKVIDGPFKGRLELVPVMREALRHYSRADYGQCLSLLQHSIRRDLLLDIHLHPHVPILLDMIRDRCIVQYFQPYSSVSLEKMGKVFGCNAKEMEDVVAKLIGNGGVDGMPLGDGARINALDKTLSVEGQKSVEKKARRRARVKAAKMGVQFERNAFSMILRVACIESGIVTQSDRRPGWRQRSARARDGGRHVADRIGPDHFESDESISDDAMDVDNHIVNPNEF